MEPVSRDTYGMDLLIVRPRPGEEELSFYVQLKNTTTVAPDIAKPHFSYQFKHRTHLEHLTVARESVKALLIVMVTDPDQSQWTTGGHEALSIVKSCYWANLEGHVIGDGVKSPTVHVPIANRFDAPAILDLLARLEAKQPL